MANRVKELGTPKILSASGALGGPGVTVMGFLCASSTSGTVKITSGATSGGSDVVAETPVTAGSWTPIPGIFLDGAYAVLTNCTGTFFL